jgi:sugar phosphate isomerase/epimerase
MRIAVVLEALAGEPLHSALGFLRQQAPQVSGVEVDVGGYAPARHCDMGLLLRDNASLREFADGIASFGLAISALNAWGNPLHPDPDIASRHRDDLLDAVRLAGALGVDRVVALAGCPAATVGDRYPTFAAGGWLPYLEGIWERQWEGVIAEEWGKIARAAAAENPDLRICLELHPGTVVYNVETFSRVAALSPSIAANLDPSHLFWMQMDPFAVIAHLGKAIAHAHGKDTSFNSDALALNGILDRRWPNDPETLPWTFSVPGRGHGAEWWTRFVDALEGTSARAISIELEDPFVSAREGIVEASEFLSGCGAGQVVIP